MPPYPLQSLLDLRGTEEKAASRKLATALEAVESARRKLEAARTDLRARRESVAGERERHEEAVARGRVYARDERAHGLYLARLKDAVDAAVRAEKAQTKAVAAAESAAEAAREALADAVRARKALESHRDGFYADEAATRERSAEEAADELAARRRR